MITVISLIDDIRAEACIINPKVLKKKSWQKNEWMKKQERKNREWHLKIWVVLPKNQYF